MTYTTIHTEEEMSSMYARILHKVQRETKLRVLVAERRALTAAVLRAALL